MQEKKSSSKPPLSKSDSADLFSAQLNLGILKADTRHFGCTRSTRNSAPVFSMLDYSEECLQAQFMPHPDV
jgi:hypothetical protein